KMVVLSPSNYLVWREHLLAILVSLHCETIVEGGSIADPELDLEVKRFISSHVAEQFRYAVVSASDSSEAYRRLAERFESAFETDLAQIQEAWRKLRLDDLGAFDDHLDKLSAEFNR